MPYVAIKAYPKDDEVKKALVERINQAVLDVVGCRQEAVTISFEDIPQEAWQETVYKPEIEAKMDKMYIFKGEKKY